MLCALPAPASLTDGCSQWCTGSLSRLSPVPSQFLVGLNMGKKEEGRVERNERRKKEGKREED